MCTVARQHRFDVCIKLPQPPSLVLLFRVHSILTNTPSDAMRCMRQYAHAQNPYVHDLLTCSQRLYHQVNVQQNTAVLVLELQIKETGTPKHIPVC